MGKKHPFTIDFRHMLESPKADVGPGWKSMPLRPGDWFGSDGRGLQGELRLRVWLLLRGERDLGMSQDFWWSRISGGMTQSIAIHNHSISPFTYVQHQSDSSQKRTVWTIRWDLKRAAGSYRATAPTATVSPHHPPHFPRPQCEGQVGGGFMFHPLV